MRKISNKLKQYERYNNRLQNYKDIVDKAPPKRTFEENKHKVIEDIITRSRGRPKKEVDSVFGLSGAVLRPAQPKPKAREFFSSHL